MPKCDFNNVALQLYRNRISHGCSAVNLLHISRTLSVLLHFQRLCLMKKYLYCVAKLTINKRVSFF